MIAGFFLGAVLFRDLFSMSALTLRGLGVAAVIAALSAPVMLALSLAVRAVTGLKGAR
jgi:hypothetical protein